MGLGLFFVSYILLYHRSVRRSHHIALFLLHERIRLFHARIWMLTRRPMAEYYLR